MSRNFSLSYFMIILLTLSISLVLMFNSISANPDSWPLDSQWIWIDWDKNEDGAVDDWRDVKNAYYYFDGDYLYLRLECYAAPGSEWKVDTKISHARYKWFINTTQKLYISGGNIIGASYLLFVEDTDNDGNGEIYLLKDITGDGKFDEYGPGQTYDYRNYEVTDPTNATFRITGNYIDMKVKWASLKNPASYGLMWATDQENPNLNQAPTTDHPDEEIGLVRHDVAAISQAVSATEVERGEKVEIAVEIRNYGTSSETFDVTVYFGPTIIGVKSVTQLPAGGSVILSFTWDTSLVPSGTYTITAFADSAGVITEVDEDNNWCTAPATVTVKIHDVAAISQTTDKTLVKQGESVRIDVVVKNLGDFTETFDVTVYYDNTQIGTKTVSNLAPGTETTVSFDWDTRGVNPETYFIKAFVDSSRTITEFNEANNNCTTITPVVIYTPAEPGISVEKILIGVVSGPDPAIVGYSTTYEIEILVVNTGNVELQKINVTDYIWEGVTYVSLGTPSTGTAEYRTVNSKPVIVWNITGLEPLNYATLRFRITLQPSSSGVFILNRGQDLTVVAKYGDTIYRDTADLDVVVSAYTRDVKAVSQTPLKTPVIQGEIVGIDVVVENSGDYYGEKFDVTLYYSLDGTTWTEIEPIDTIRVFNLGIGGKITLRFEWDTEGVSPGTYYIRAMADSGNELPETDETNNDCTEPAAIKIEIHDVVAVSQSTDVTSAVQGDLITITGVLRNDGSETETFTVRCYYSAPEIPPVQIGSDQVITLGRGESGTLNFVWDTSSVNPGTYWIEIRALPVAGELDTDDNTCTIETPVTIAERPYYVGGEVIAHATPTLKNATTLIMLTVIILIIATLTTTILLLRKTKDHHQK